MTIITALKGIRRMLLDTAPAIYYIEGNPQYAHVMKPLFEQIEANQIMLVTTPITVAECLVGTTDPHVISLYLDFLTNSSNTLLIPLTLSEATQASQFRQSYNLRLADAFQAAVAKSAGCDAILTNDPIFKRVPGFRKLIVDELQP
jgi:predicted nucleic acid-binding protein